MNIKGLITVRAAGSGKTTIACRLAEKLDWEFIEADEFHPPENIAKMKAGIPLEDSDRAPWLAALHEKLVFTPCWPARRSRKGIATPYEGKSTACNLSISKTTTICYAPVSSSARGITWGRSC